MIIDYFIHTKQVLSRSEEHLGRYSRQIMEPVTRLNIARQLLNVENKFICNRICEDYGANELQLALENPFRVSLHGGPKYTARFRQMLAIRVKLCKNICDNIFPG